jgi:hypothetical protein
MGNIEYPEDSILMPKQKQSQTTRVALNFCAPASCSRGTDVHKGNGEQLPRFLPPRSPEALSREGQLGSTGSFSCSSGNVAIVVAFHRVTEYMIPGRTLSGK